MEIARGNKTIIRTFTRADLDRRQNWKRFEDPLYLIYNMPKMSKEENDRWFREKMNDRRSKLFAVDDLLGNMIGMITLRDINWILKRAVLGIVLAPDSVGMGLGSDALRAFLRYFFEDMGFKTLLLDVASFNTRAKHCYEKCGFRYIRSRWVKDVRGVNVFGDDRFKDLRKFFRRSKDDLEVLFEDMCISRKEWFKASVRAMETENRAR
ncbi:MAG: GNAT family N-acetyltransferase [bacterium]